MVHAIWEGVNAAVNVNFTAVYVANRVMSVPTQEQ